MKCTFLFATSVAAAVSLSAFQAIAQNSSLSQRQFQVHEQPLVQSAMSVAEIAVHLESQGYTVYEIERERTHYEVKMIDGSGLRVMAYLDLVTGEVLRSRPTSDDRDRYDD